jgi:sarcosine oxidase subunit beta
MPSAPLRIAVVGAGIAGLALALEARLLGAAVTVIEARYPGSGNSTRNVGRVRRMQPSEDLTRFAVRAHDKWLGLHRLLGGRNPLVYPTRYAWILYGADEVEKLAPLEPVWARLGARARLVDARAALRAVPVLRGGEPIVGAVLGEATIVHHDAAVYGYMLACRELGVEIRSGLRAEGISVTAGRVTGLETAAGLVPADAVVNAAGGRGSAEFARACGIDPPNRPVRREALAAEPSRPFMGPAVTFYRPLEGWFNQTLRGELVAGVVRSDEPLEANERSSLPFLVQTARLVMTKAPRLGGLRVIRQWAGVYDLTPDRRPLIGDYGRPAGLYALNGWSGRGFAFAPLAAELLARRIIRDEHDPLLAPFAPQRFSNRPCAVDVSRDYYSSY